MPRSARWSSPRHAASWSSASARIRRRAGFGQKLRDRLRARRITGNPQDYYATLVTAVAQPDELRFFIGGDGAFAIEYADGEIDVTAVSWWHNAPYYPGIRDDPAVDPLVRRMYESCPHGPACETRLG